MNKRKLDILLENNDNRGSVFRGNYYEKEIFLIAEIKKGMIRGGHYHNKTVYHHVLNGKIIYKEIQLTKKGNHKKNNKEIKKNMKSGDVVKTPKYAAHILIAKEDSIVFETSDVNKETINYQKYRNQIKITKK